ncbi:MAG TPA: caspase family protein [Syntrophales bacterium]|nr:caspase family protein [Syntrophales bacterium]
MKSIFIQIVLISLLLASAIPSLSQSETERRTALVVGNSNYESLPLKNQVNDASDMALALQKVGFTVVLKNNADLQTMEEAIEDFGNKLKQGGVGLFYYAGHGLQVNGINYLVPIRAKIVKETDVKYKAVDIGRVLDEMSNANNGLNIVILDACRDNPLTRSFRSANRGLAIISTAPTGTFIAYSTGPGQVAQDGERRNSPFTAALIESIKIPDIPVEQVFKRVRQKMDTSSGGKHVPWELSSIKGDFYFNPPAKAAVAEITTSHEPNPILRQAQIAYEQGNFAEPEGENIIELALQVLRDEPGNQSARDLVARSASAYENQAKLALAKEDKNMALRIYRRLFKLFPDQENYLRETIALEKSAVPDIVGV